MDVRADLEARGYTFRSRTDTEVILKAYEEWGPECLRRLNGMFAFAIHDSRAGELFIARDRLGVKPLYYWTSGGRFAFASEIKSLLGDPRIPRTPDLESMFHYLGYEFVPAPRTMFDGIKKLPPSHYLILRPGQQPEIRRYWDVSFPDEEEHDEQWYRDGLMAHIDAAVKQRLIADVPLGVFLSGGIDSSAIVAYMHRHVKEPLKTFSLGYADPYLFRARIRPPGGEGLRHRAARADHRSDLDPADRDRGLAPRRADDRSLDHPLPPHLPEGPRAGHRLLERRRRRRKLRRLRPLQGRQVRRDVPAPPRCLPALPDLAGGRTRCPISARRRVLSTSSSASSRARTAGDRRPHALAVLPRSRALPRPLPPARLAGGDAGSVRAGARAVSPASAGGIAWIARSMSTSASPCRTRA